VKNWKTTLGGSIETLGAGLRDATLITSLGQLGVGEDFHKLNFYLAVTGVIVTLIGKFFSNLFAADATAVNRQLAEHTAEITQIKGDTTQLKKAME